MNATGRDSNCFHVLFRGIHPSTRRSIEIRALFSSVPPEQEVDSFCFRSGLFDSARVLLSGRIVSGLLSFFLSSSRSSDFFFFLNNGIRSDPRFFRRVENVVYLWVDLRGVKARVNRS